VTSEAGELSQSSFFNASLSSRTKTAPSAAISSPSGVDHCVVALQHKLCDDTNNSNHK
jgi:primosomal replication protein N